MATQTPQWTTGPDSSTRCTQTVLMQFGIFDRVPENGWGVLQALLDNGWTYDVHYPLGIYTDNLGTVSRFVREHPTGRWYIVTKGHAMAVIDGVLVDSAAEGPNRRRLLAAYEVYRKEQAA